MQGTRFVCPSLRLSLKVLGRRSGILAFSLALALILHGAGIKARLGDMETAKTAKPLTTQFVKRKPRLTKPLELKKRPRRRRRMMHRQMVSVSASTYFCCKY